MTKKIIIYKNVLLVENYTGENLISAIEFSISEKVSEFISNEIDHLIYKHINDK